MGFRGDFLGYFGVTWGHPGVILGSFGLTTSFFLCSQQVRSTRLVFCCNVVLYMWRFIYHTAVFVFSFVYENYECIGIYTMRLFV